MPVCLDGRKVKNVSK